MARDKPKLHKLTLQAFPHLLTLCINPECKREIYLVSPFEFYKVSGPQLACSADCLLVWERTEEAWLEKNT